MSNSSERPPYYGSQAIHSDKKVRDHRDYIYTQMLRVLFIFNK